MPWYSFKSDLQKNAEQQGKLRAAEKDLLNRKAARETAITGERESPTLKLEQLSLNVNAARSKVSQINDALAGPKNEIINLTERVETLKTAIKEKTSWPATPKPGQKDAVYMLNLLLSQAKNALSISQTKLQELEAEKEQAEKEFNSAKKTQTKMRAKLEERMLDLERTHDKRIAKAEEKVRTLGGTVEPRSRSTERSDGGRISGNPAGTHVSGSREDTITIRSLSSDDIKKFQAAGKATFEEMRNQFKGQPTIEARPDGSLTLNLENVNDLEKFLFARAAAGDHAELRNKDGNVEYKVQGGHVYKHPDWINALTTSQDMRAEATKTEVVNPPEIIQPLSPVPMNSQPSTLPSTPNHQVLRDVVEPSQLSAQNQSVNTPQEPSKMVDSWSALFEANRQLVLNEGLAPLADKASSEAFNNAENSYGKAIMEYLREKNRQQLTTDEIALLNDARDAAKSYDTNSQKPSVESRVTTQTGEKRKDESTSPVDASTLANVIATRDEPIARGLADGKVKKRVTWADQEESAAAPSATEITREQEGKLFEKVLETAYELGQCQHLPTDDPTRTSKQTAHESAIDIYIKTGRELQDQKIVGIATEKARGISDRLLVAELDAVELEVELDRQPNSSPSTSAANNGAASSPDLFAKYLRAEFDISRLEAKGKASQKDFQNHDAAKTDYFQSKGGVGLSKLEKIQLRMAEEKGRAQGEFEANEENNSSSHRLGK